MKFKRILFLLPLLLIAGSAGCDNENLYDQLSESRLKVILKGTYESNDPRPWDTTIISDDSMMYVNPDQRVTSGGASYPAAFPQSFKIDIAKICLDGDKFANYRKLYTSSISDADPFFNGQGVLFKNDDVTPGKQYYNAQIYLRKMIFDNADIFLPSSSNTERSSFLEKAEVIFNEVTTNGFDFNTDQVYALYDLLREETAGNNRVFPYSVPISGGFITDSEQDAVLEIRFVIKNFVKQYEHIKYDDVIGYESYHVFGLSDWLRDVHVMGSAYQGGNLISAARVYNPDSVGTITGSAGSTNCYVMAIPEDEVANLADYSFNAAKRLRPADEYNPLAPSYYASDFGMNLLNYYAEYERYKSEYEKYYVHMNDTTSTGYEQVWLEYAARISAFKMPPIVTWGGAAGTYTLANIPVGKQYRIYRSGTVNIGELPETWTARASDAAVSVAANGQVTTADF